MHYDDVLLYFFPSRPSATPTFCTVSYPNYFPCIYSPMFYFLCPRKALGDDELVHRRLVELNVQEQCVKVRRLSPARVISYMRRELTNFLEIVLPFFFWSSSPFWVCCWCFLHVYPPLSLCWRVSGIKSRVCCLFLILCSWFCAPMCVRACSCVLALCLSMQSV